MQQSFVESLLTCIHLTAMLVHVPLYICAGTVALHTFTPVLTTATRSVPCRKTEKPG